MLFLVECLFGTLESKFFHQKYLYESWLALETPRCSQTCKWRSSSVCDGFMVIRWALWRWPYPYNFRISSSVYMDPNNLIVIGLGGQIGLKFRSGCKGWFIPFLIQMRGNVKTWSDWQLKLESTAHVQWRKNSIMTRGTSCYSWWIKVS